MPYSLLWLDKRFTLLLSAAFGKLPPVRLVGWLLATKLPRVQVQVR